MTDAFADLEEELASEQGGERKNGHKPPRAHWPVLAPEAMHGVVGDIVRAISPYTEADEVAILVSLLLGCGNVVHRTPHALVEATRHPLNLFAVLVGDTAKGRKGTAWDRAEDVLRTVEPAWANARITSGLSSGEGLITAVADPSDRKDKEGKPLTPGVADKRLLVVEEEFAKTLKVMSRENNILSTVLRQAWDSKPLRSLTKNDPLSATGAHISILGHCTSVELRKHLNETESANGFGNRFLWVCVRRSKELPEGGGEVNISPHVKRLHDALCFARERTQPVMRDPVAATVWRAVYGPLSDGGMTLIDSLTSRAEAQVLRLSVLYALLDQSALVRPVHLLAALAVWDYCLASACYVFAGNWGDETTERIVTCLMDAGTAGATGTDINTALGRNVPSSEIQSILAALIEAGVVREEKQEATTGRPAIRYWVNADDPLIRKFVRFAIHVPGTTYLALAKAALIREMNAQRPQKEETSIRINELTKKVSPEGETEEVKGDAGNVRINELSTDEERDDYYDQYAF